MIVTILLISLSLLKMNKSEAVTNRYLKPGDNTFWYCPDIPTSWKYLNNDTGTVQQPISTSNGVSTSTDTLTIYNIKSLHEGLYTCVYNNQQQASLNLTVVGVPQFEGCTPSTSNCDIGTILTVTEGHTIPLNISLQFVNGGLRGVRQSLNSISFYKSSSPNSPLIDCYSPSSCNSHTSRIGGNYSINNSWELFFNISNATIDDSGIYIAKVELLNPNNDNYISSTISYRLNITVVTEQSSTIQLSPTSSNYEVSSTSSLPTHFSLSHFSSTHTTSSHLSPSYLSPSYITSSHFSPSQSLPTHTTPSHILSTLSSSLSIETSLSSSSLSSQTMTPTILTQKEGTEDIVLPLIVTLLIAIISMTIILIIICIIMGKRKDKTCLPTYVHEVKPHSPTPPTTTTVVMYRRESDDSSVCSSIVQEPMYSTIPYFNKTLPKIQNSVTKTI